MSEIPVNVQEFILKNNVLSLSVINNDSPWSANCFYVYDANKQCFIVLTSHKTLHGELMLKNPHISGTIAAQPEKFTQVAGLQFLATAERITAPQEHKQAFALYTQKHAIAHLAKLAQTDIWYLWLDQIKFNENKLMINRKTNWIRQE